ncbi:MAG: iron uptake porin [Coleofasciculaceae cyanobacterium RL_1_1]|nr:iron uptake porin [Coleofasciculaceae cyanobacterium RL_1_1]
MQKSMWNLLLASPAALLVGLTANANATEAVKPAVEVEASKELSVNDFITESNRQELNGTSVSSLDQVTSVSQLSDVQPTDWAFQALQSLVERYGCIAGYPDGTFRGNRALTRYEFAAGLNACLDQILAQVGGPGLDPGDLETIKKLQEDFAAQLASLRGRVDSLESRLDTVEAQQFSTTTKLVGEVAFTVTDAWGLGDDSFVEGGGDLDDNQTTFSDRVRLDFVSSFTGEDALHTRLDAGNTGGVSGLEMDGFAHGFDNGNDVGIGWLAYYFPIGDNIQVYVSPWGALWQDFAPTISPMLEGYTGANHTISSFAESSPIYKIGTNSSGVGVNAEFGDLVASVGYFAQQAGSSSPGQGLFNGQDSILAQLAYLGDSFQAALTYNRTYMNGGGIYDSGIGGIGTASANGLGVSESNTYGIEFAFMPTDTIGVNLFGGYTDADSTTLNEDNLELWFYGLGVGVQDFGGEGNLLGLFAGAQPYLGSTTIAGNTGDDVPIHVEAFYRYALNDYINITPGLIWQTAPGGDNDNEDALVGVLRTTFNF